MAQSGISAEKDRKEEGVSFHLGRPQPSLMTGCMAHVIETAQWSLPTSEDRAMDTEEIRFEEVKHRSNADLLPVRGSRYV
jgi:hypothetical protein